MNRKYKRGDVVLVQTVQRMYPEKDFFLECPLGICKVVRYNAFDAKAVRICSQWDRKFKEGQEVGFYAKEVDLILIKKVEDEV